MATKVVILLVLGCIVGGCVSGAPELTPEQDRQWSAVHVYRPGESPDAKFTAIGDVSAADCSAAPAGGRVWGNAEKAIESLQKKAVVAGANAVVDVQCAAAPFLNNCWAAQKCTGRAVRFE